MTTTLGNKGAPFELGRCRVEHCGHPTAIWPYALFVDGAIVAAPNGKAFTCKAFAVAAAEAIEAGRVEVHQRSNRPASKPPVLIAAGDVKAGEEWRERCIFRAWEAIGIDFDAELSKKRGTRCNAR